MVAPVDGIDLGGGCSEALPTLLTGATTRDCPYNKSRLL